MKISKLIRFAAIPVCSLGLLLPGILVVNHQVTETINHGTSVGIDPTGIQIIGSDTIGPKATFQESGSYQYLVTGNPEGADLSVNWSLENPSGGNDITITQNGLLKWNQNLLVNQTYIFTIKATSQLISNISDQIVVYLHVDYATATSVEIKPYTVNNLIEGFANTPDEMISPFEISVLPANANQATNLLITSSDVKTQSLIDNQQIYIHDQKIAWTSLEIGQYPITLHASVLDREDINTISHVVLDITKNPSVKPNNSFEASSLTPLLIILPFTILLIAITIPIVLKIRSRKDYEY